MILTKEKILQEIKLGNIEIDPFDEQLIGPASVDLHLGGEFRRFKHYNNVYPVTDEANFEDITELAHVPTGGFLLLKSGETILGITEERIKLSPGLCGWIEGRSRFARIGLGVHITSGFAQPGVNNRTVLEMTNLSPNPLALYPGTKICQFLFQRTDGSAQYAGRFQHQSKP